MLKEKTVSPQGTTQEGIVFLTSSENEDIVVEQQVILVQSDTLEVGNSCTV